MMAIPILGFFLNKCVLDIKQKKIISICIFTIYNDIDFAYALSDKEKHINKINKISVNQKKKKIKYVINFFHNLFTNSGYF